MNPIACKKNNMLLNMVYFKDTYPYYSFIGAKEENIVFINTNGNSTFD